MIAMSDYNLTPKENKKNEHMQMKYNLYVYDARARQEWVIINGYDKLLAAIECAEKLFACGMEVIIRREDE